jgi:endonuclease/exonuclease/phosphatase family metal-dependent hydrolase
MRRSLVAVIIGFLVMTGLQVQPAGAASKKPSKVALVSFVKANYDRNSNRTTLSLDWPDARHAKKYEIFVSRYSSMKKAKKYVQKSSKTTIKKLIRGKDYYVQVRGVNGKKHGPKSAVVGRTTILRPGPATGLMPLRVMTFNVCSRVCGDNGYPWISRQPAVWERIASSGADVVATQEADHLNEVPGYTLAVDFSAKQLWYNAARFMVPGATTPPLAFKPAVDPVTKCRVSSDPAGTTGEIFLGRHGGGCRYAVWAELVERSTGRSVLMVSLHTVSGKTKATTDYRRAEINQMLASIKQVNSKRLQVIYAGDVNSHRESRPSDSVRPPMQASKHYDAFDMARKVAGQHQSSYNGFKTKPVISVKWGNHIDKVWVDPWKVRVDGWRNFALLNAKGNMVEPIPSDHSPVVVDLRIG